MSSEYRDEVVVVTGASRGIGAAIARSFADSGASVAVTARDETALDSVADTIAKDTGTRPLCVAADVTSVNAVRRTVDTIAQELGPPTVLINNAGINIPRPAADVTESEWDQIIDTNLKGPFFFAQAAGLHMRRREQGRIINIASAAGLIAAEDRVAYASSKAGLIMQTKVLALEWSGRGITVNAVAPTFVETDLARQTLSVPGKRDYWLSKIPRGRLATTGDIVAAVRFLASGEADFITGVVLPVDGGLSI